jgi:hypothetical protein
LKKLWLLFTGPRTSWSRTTCNLSSLIRLNKSNGSVSIGENLT